MNTKALVTIAMGDDHIRNWRTYCLPSWEKYAIQYGYDIVVIDQPIEPSLLTEARPVHWQKCFILEHDAVKNYEYAVWIDTDIIINYHHAPCIVSTHVSDKIGAVSLTKASDREFYNTIARFIPFKSYYLNCAKSPDNEPLYQKQFRQMKNNYSPALKTEERINTGVLVMKPSLHADFMRQVYFKYLDKSDTVDFEQGALSSELIQNDMLFALDPGFNVIYYLESVQNYPFLYSFGLEQEPEILKKLTCVCATTVYANSYFLHFPGDKSHMRFVATDIQDEFMIPSLWSRIT